MLCKAIIRFKILLQQLISLVLFLNLSLQESLLKKQMSLHSIKNTFQHFNKKAQML